MNIFTKYKTVIIVAILVILAFVGYSLFFVDDTENGTLVTQPVGTQGGVVGSEIISVLNDLKTITLDDSVFDGPTFNQLEDFSFEIVGKPVGRVNPFAPIGAIEDFQDSSEPDEPADVEEDDDNQE